MAKWIQLQAQFALRLQQQSDQLDDMDNKPNQQVNLPLDFSFKSGSNFASLASLMMNTPPNSSPSSLMPSQEMSALHKMSQMAAASQRSPLTPAAAATAASARFHSLPMLTLPYKSGIPWQPRYVQYPKLAFKYTELTHAYTVGL